MRMNQNEDEEKKKRTRAWMTGIHVFLPWLCFTKSMKERTPG